MKLMYIPFHDNNPVVDLNGWGYYFNDFMQARNFVVDRQNDQGLLTRQGNRVLTVGYMNHDFRVWDEKLLPKYDQPVNRLTYYFKQTGMGPQTLPRSKVRCIVESPGWVNFAGRA